MAEIGESSSSSSSKISSSKPVIVRVKRKAFQSPLQAFWLEINERPLKRRPLLDFHKLSLSDSPPKVEESKTKRVFVHHVETLSNSKVNTDILQPFVADTVNQVKSISKSEERRHSFKTNTKQDQLLEKAKKEQEVLSKNARFEQIWRKRKGTKGAHQDEALHEMCQLYDVVRVDFTETTSQTKEQEDTELEDHMIMSSFLPLLREFIPSAASEIESEIDDYMSKGESNKDDYVYDLYTVNVDVPMSAEDASNPFPLVQVDEDDDFYDGPDESENESYDSNAEGNPLNEYPDEETSSDEEETESRSSGDVSEDKASITGSESLGPEGSEHQDLVGDEMYGDDDWEDYDDDDGGSDDQSNYY